MEKYFYFSPFIYYSCVRIDCEFLRKKKPNPNLYSNNQLFSPVFCTNQNNFGFLANKMPNEYANIYFTTFCSQIVIALATVVSRCFLACMD